MTVMHAQLRVVCQVEHHLDPRRQLPDRVAGQLIGNSVQPIGQRIGLLSQHREEYSSFDAKWR